MGGTSSLNLLVYVTRLTRLDTVVSIADIAVAHAPSANQAVSKLNRDGWGSGERGGTSTNIHSALWPGRAGFRLVDR